MGGRVGVAKASSCIGEKDIKLARTCIGCGVVV